MIYIFYLLSCICVVGTFLPLLDNAHWLIRGQAYFHAFYSFLSLLLLMSMLFAFPLNFGTGMFCALLLFAFIFSTQSILAFTPLAKVEVKSAKIEAKSNELSILIFNVYQYNKQYKKLIELVKRENPDLVFLVETNNDWSKGLEALKDSYPFHFSDVRENTYGLIVLSKIEIKEGGINYLVKSDIPSAEVLLSINKQKLRILGLHPRPPIPGEALSTRSKDKELVQAANYLNAQVEDDHHILIGDLNDVAWSRASRAFKNSTGMLDPRVGRGFFPTFPTWSPIGFPLDHVFCSPGLELVNFMLLENIGSDHYPVLVSFHIPDKNCIFRR